MQPRQPDRRAAVFEEAAALPPEERARFLDERCAAEPELRRDVEELLSLMDSDTANILERHPPALPMADPQPGDTVGRYIVEQAIGSGGMSAVYRARDPGIDRKIALKLLTPFGFEAQGKRQFFRELRLLGSITHDNIVRVYDFGEDAGRPFIVTELLTGENLGEAIAGGRCGDWQKKLEIATQIARALQHVHAAGIVHRDVKPANVFVVRGGPVKLLDFGIAKSVESTRTATTAHWGTPAYMAPEQIRGEPAVRVSDIYAYGLLLFELFSGRRVYEGSAESIAYRKLHEPAPTQTLAGTVPPELMALVRRATARDPRERPNSFDDVIAILDRLARPPGRPTSKRLRWLAAAVGTAGAIAIGIVASRSPAPPPPSAVERNVTLELVRPARGIEPVRTLPLVLEQGDQFRIQLQSSQQGHLYLLSESSERTMLNVLFPSPTANEGRSLIQAGSALQIPERSWFEFGPTRGVERLWFIWSRTPQEPLEAAKRWANQRDRGAIGDAEERARLRAWLPAAAPSLRLSAGRLLLEGTLDPLVGVFSVEHR